MFHLYGNPLLYEDLFMIDISIKTTNRNPIFVVSSHDGSIHTIDEYLFIIQILKEKFQFTAHKKVDGLRS